MSSAASETTSLFHGYETAGYDEMFAEPGAPRPHYSAMHDRLAGINPEELERRHRVADLSMRHQGITFTVYGRDQGVERIIPFDPIPRLVAAGRVGAVIDAGPEAAGAGPEPVPARHLPRTDASSSDGQ